MRKKDESISNFLPVNRKFFDHPFWKEGRTFSKSEAWLDLMRSARFEESTAKELIGGKLVCWTRGQLPASLRFLSDRWNWSKNKVDDFLKLLEKETMIERTLFEGQTIISLLNYEVYNSRGQPKGHEKGQQNQPAANVSPYVGDSEKDSKGDERGTAEGQRGDKTNTSNKVNKEEEERGASAPAHSQEDLNLFNAFMAFINKNAPKVNQMKEPLTIKQFLKLRKDFPGESGKKLIKEIILNMHNKKSLLKDYESTNLTIRSWINLRNKNGTGVNGSAATSEVNEKLKSAK